MLHAAERLLLVFLVSAVGFNVVTFVASAALARRPARHLLAAFWKETLATFVLIPAWPLFALLGAEYQLAHEGEGEAKPKRPPVILLHGYLMNRTNWLWFGPALAKRGVGPLYGLSYFSLAPIERSSRRLLAFIDEVCAREGVAQVDIVAHSLGGLVARFAIEHLGAADRVRRLVTIATPHHGTRFARLGIGPVSRDLLPDSAVLSRLGRPPRDARYTSIWSRADNLVLPPDSSQLTWLADAAADAGDAAEAAGEGGTGPEIAKLDEELGRRSLEDVVFDDLGHLSLLVSPRVVEKVAERLAS